MINQKRITQLFLYSFTILIVVVTISNIVNTLSNDIENKSKNFAILNTLGMTKKQFLKISFLEYLTYLSISFVLGGCFSIFVNYIIYFLEPFYYLYTFKMPVIEMGIVLALLGVILFIMMLYLNKKLKTNHIIEIIKDENRRN